MQQCEKDLLDDSQAEVLQERERKKNSEIRTKKLWINVSCH